MPSSMLNYLSTRCTFTRGCSSSLLSVTSCFCPFWGGCVGVTSRFFGGGVTSHFFGDWGGVSGGGVWGGVTSRFFGDWDGGASGGCGVTSRFFGGGVTSRFFGVDTGVAWGFLPFPFQFLPSLKLKSLSFSLVSSVSAFHVFPLQNSQNHWSWNSRPLFLQFPLFTFFHFRTLRITGAGIRDLLFIRFLEFFLNYFLFWAWTVTWTVHRFTSSCFLLLLLYRLFLWLFTIWSRCFFYLLLYHLFLWLFTIWSRCFFYLLFRPCLLYLLFLHFLISTRCIHGCINSLFLCLRLLLFLTSFVEIVIRIIWTARNQCIQWKPNDTWCASLQLHNAFTSCIYIMLPQINSLHSVLHR